MLAKSLLKNYNFTLPKMHKPYKIKRIGTKALVPIAPIQEEINKLYNQILENQKLFEPTNIIPNGFIWDNTPKKPSHTDFLPTIECFGCGKALDSSILDYNYSNCVTMTHSCCNKVETLEISKEALLNDKVPKVWVAFISSNPKIV